MKRALRVLILGPIMLVGLTGLTLAYPLVLFVDWVTEEPTPIAGGIWDLWGEALRGVWG